MTFSYSAPARIAELQELAAAIAPMELRGCSEAFAQNVLPGLLLATAARSRTYAVRLDGRLAGICFIQDLGSRREMAFTKTRYLVEERKIAFARAIPQLLADLAREEARRRRDAKPMYMHTPEGDEKSKRWFVRAGCVETERGLRCPGANNERS